MRHLIIAIGLLLTLIAGCTHDGDSGTPDLVIVGLAGESLLDPYPLVAGEVSDLAFGIHNAGTGEAKASVRVDLYDSTEFNTFALFEIKVGPGDTWPIRNLSYMAPSSDGSYTLTLEVDVTDKVEESNEGNNSTTFNILVGGATGTPDLEVVPATDSTPFLNPSSIAYGGTSWVSFGIRNNGTADVTSSYVVRTTDDVGFSIDSVESFDIPAGSTVDFIQYGAYAGAVTGTRTVTVTVDITNAITESDETNNSYSGTVVVGAGGTSDLEVVAPAGGDPVFSPNPLGLGGLAVVSFGIRNNGTADVTASFEVELWDDISGMPIGGDGLLIINTDIPAGSTVDFAPSGIQYIGSPTKVGTRSVSIMADWKNTIAESNEANNTLVSTLEVLSTLIFSDG